jgi:DNA-binding response OmpR family regulator
MKMRILIIEDEFNLADAICSRLEKEKYNCDIACDGAQGLDYALTNAYDLIILDIMLPTMNGVDILKQLKDEGIESKVIMLTAKTMIDDK